MNALHKHYQTFILFFSVLTSANICADYTYRSPDGAIYFIDRLNNNNSNEHKSPDDFSYNSNWGNSHYSRTSDDFSHDRHWRNSHYNRTPTNKHQFKYYTATANDFQAHFAAREYTESQILDQRCLYMFDEFVKFAQTYSAYKCAIQQLYTELKNLGYLQKAYRIIKGTYCAGLQKRIQFLYNQLDTIKASQPNNNNIPSISTADLHKLTNSHALTKFDDQVAEYNTLDSAYRTHTPSLSNAIEKRLNAYDRMSPADASRHTIQTYFLNNNIRQLLHKYGHTAQQFDTCFGNPLDHVIHRESLDILGRVDSLLPNSLLYDHQEALIDFTVAMVNYNHEGLTDKAMIIGDLCWTLLDLGQAVAEGAALGVYSAASDILTHPIETTLCIIAGKEILAYQLCKVIYNVADIGVTAMTDRNHAKEKWNNYTKPLNNIIDAFNNKEISLRDAIKGGTNLVVGLYAQHKMLGGLGKFCNTVKQKSINFIQKSPLLKPQDYLATPEGLLLKATNNIKPTSNTSAAKVKSTVERAAKNDTLKNSKVPTKSALTSSTSASKGIIRNVKDDLRSTIARYQKHIFSDDHKKKGILALGKNEETIMDSLYNIIMSLDKKGLLKEGNNQIKASINGINNVEIKCFIQNGEAISANAYLSEFSRIYGNFVDATKV